MGKKLKKFDHIWRVIVALALVFALVAVMATPVAADGVEGTIALDADYYQTGDTVTVTVEDADENVAHTAANEKSTTSPNGTEVTFTLEHTPIDAAAVTEVDDLAGTAYTVDSVGPDQVTLTAAPPTTAEFLAAIAIDVNLSLTTQPAHATPLTVTVDPAPGGAEYVNVSISGWDADGSPLSEMVYIVGTATEETTLSEFASVAEGGVDAGKTAGAASATIAISAPNAVYVDYGYSDLDTVTISAVSTSDPVGISVDLSETGVNTGVFEGPFTLHATASNDAADELLATECNTITVSYEDLDPAGTRTAEAGVDNTAPTITVVSPADLSATNDNTPTISAELADAKSGIDEGTIAMTVAGSSVTPDYDAETGLLSYTPVSSLEDGSVTVVVDVSDVAGNAATTETWSFDVDTVVPGAISDLSATAKPLRIELAWSVPTDPAPPSGIDHYNVYRSTTEGVEAIADNLIGSSITNAYVASTGEDGVTYY